MYSEDPYSGSRQYGIQTWGQRRSVRCAPVSWAKNQKFLTPERETSEDLNFFRKLVQRPGFKFCCTFTRCINVGKPPPQFPLFHLLKQAGNSMEACYKNKMI